MNTLAHSGRAFRLAPALRWGAWIVLLAWGGFWAFFSVAEMVSGEPGAIMHVLFPLAPIAALLALAWLRPFLGGAMLVLFGGATLFLAGDPFVWGLLAAPPILGGAILATIARPSGGAKNAGAPS